MRKKEVRIDLFQNNVSQYGVLAHCTAAFQRALHRNHIQSKLYDFQKQSAAEIFAELQKEKPDYTFGFNMFLGSSHTGPYASLAIAHIAAIVDAVSHYPELFSDHEITVLLAEKDSMQLLQKMGNKKSLYFPHAVDRELVQSPLSTKRHFDIVLPATFIDPDELLSLWKECFSPTTIKRLQGLVEVLLASPTESQLHAVPKCLQTHPEISRELEVKGWNMFDLINSVESMMRGLDKIRLVGALKDLPFTIIGPIEDEPKWKKYTKSNVRFLGALSFDALISFFRESRVVINSMPTIKQGLHERLLYALGAGARVITQKNGVLPDFFSENRAVSYFLPPNYKDIAESIYAMLIDEEKRLQDIVEARSIIAEHHTWDQRVYALKKSLG